MLRNCFISCVVLETLSVIFNMLALRLCFSFKLSFEKIEKSIVTLEGNIVLPKTAKFFSRKQFSCLYLLHSKANTVK